jgi:hypothetical protein
MDQREAQLEADWARFETEVQKYVASLASKSSNSRRSSSFRLTLS